MLYYYGSSSHNFVYPIVPVDSYGYQCTFIRPCLVPEKASVYGSSSKIDCITPLGIYDAYKYAGELPHYKSAVFTSNKNVVQKGSILGSLLMYTDKNIWNSEYGDHGSIIDVGFGICDENCHRISPGAANVRYFMTKSYAGDKSPVKKYVKKYEFYDSTHFSSFPVNYYIGNGDDGVENINITWRYNDSAVGTALLVRVATVMNVEAASDYTVYGHYGLINKSRRLALSSFYWAPVLNGGALLYDYTRNSVLRDTDGYQPRSKQGIVSQKIHNDCFYSYDYGVVGLTSPQNDTEVVSIPTACLMATDGTGNIDNLKIRITSMIKRVDFILQSNL